MTASGAAAQTPPRVEKLAMGASQSCALLEGGRVACWFWGDVAVDALGDFLVSSYSPPALPSLRALAVGGAHACGVSTVDGTVWCWGSNLLGQLGRRGEGGARATRISSERAFVDVTAGRDHTCALTNEGEAWCWGDQWEGSTGTLPTGETVRDPSPVRGSRRFAQLSAGDRHTCGVTTTGDPACWGDNSTGAIRDDDWRTFFSPVDVRGIGKVATVYSGVGTSCALPADGTPVCWGRAADPPPAGSDVVFAQLALAEGAVCGARPSGEVDCWESGATEAVAREMRFDGRPLRASSLAGAGSRLCGVTEGGVVCWDVADRAVVRRLRLVVTN